MIRTTHAGSLPRPEELTALYARRAQGEAIDEDMLAQLAHTATINVVARQHAVGVDIPSNGEQEREAFFLYVQRRMSGFGGQWTRPSGSELRHYPDFAAARQQQLAGKQAVSNFNPPMAIGPVQYVDEAANLAEINHFKAALAAVEPGFADAFMTAPSPGIVAKAMKNKHYATDDAYLDAVSEALSVEYKAAIAHGLLLQIDAPDLALERHLSFADRPVGDFVRFVEAVIRRINRAVSGLPKARLRLHVCWGNYESPHDQDVALKEILPTLLTAEVGALMLPFANPRHQHELKLFKDLPLGSNQTLIVGVIDTCSNFVEHPEVIADRLCAAADYVGDANRILAGTDCGFDTSAGMSRLTPDVVWAKLRALRAGTDLANKRLF